MIQLHFTGFSYVALTILFFAAVTLIFWLTREAERAPLDPWDSGNPRPTAWAETEPMPANEGDAR